MPDIPRDSTIDATLAFGRDPYRFIMRRCHRYGSNLFQTRIMLQKTICMTGSDCARLLYEEGRFRRRGAAPGRIQRTLFGRGGVQGLDGAAHRHRKTMFVGLMTRENIAALLERTEHWWLTCARQWSGAEQVLLYDASHTLLTRAVCDWAGVPLPEDDVPRRTRELTALFDHAGDVGPKYWKARLDRTRSNRWLADVIDRARRGETQPPIGSALAVVAAHRDLQGDLLSKQVAAVELLNVLRPVVAVSVYITFVAHALATHPDLGRAVAEGGRAARERFVQEVRRFYPFFPAVPAIVNEAFVWRGYTFPQGTRVLLDIYGTNHDPDAWDEPDTFRPERFEARSPTPFDLIPQGGGDHHRNHRCPGEPITIALMEQAIDMLTGRLRYDVPEQDLAVDYHRVPALPGDRMVLRNVRVA